MSTPTERNRLEDAASPYLRQHADNPVNWQPWDEQALETAKEHDVPIFLSIGYSACHWCHVMADESFQDDGVAELLNEHFVPIKVDREERPDVDSIYMTVCQQVTGRGGWPLSAWLTPDGRPFYVGTYFPKEPQRGMPGFRDLLENIAHSWEVDREEMENRADQWTAAASDQLEATPSPPEGVETPGSELLESAAGTALRGVDERHGGWGSSGPKFPQPARLHLLLRAADRTGRRRYLEAAVRTLDAMAGGGLYDHVGDGFHRYCVDRDWTVPHFEKMLYDNAELTRAYLAAYQAVGDERYADVARRTLAFVERELTHEDGGFFSTLDAQSETEAGEREEGAFYVWTPDEIRDALSDLDPRDETGANLDDEPLADLVCDRYGVTSSGNFEGKTVLTISASRSDLADEYDLEPSTVDAVLEAARDRSFEAREERPRPNRDEKVLAGWNGLMIAAFAEAAIVLGDDAYAETAIGALAFVREHLWNADDGTLSRRYEDGEVGIDGYLEDYAFLARAALTCYEATGDLEHLSFALELARTIESEFWDQDPETLYFTPSSGESLVARPQELTDASTPSSTGVAVETLLALEHVADESFGDVAEAVLETHTSRVRSSPLEYTSIVLAADRLTTGSLELTVAADEVPRDWRNEIGSTFLPDRLLTRRPPTNDGLEAWLDALDLSEAPSIWDGREERDGEPTLYACRQRTCSPPSHDVGEALEWLLGDSGTD
ncbi:thioredoxin domain-containing protein [Natronosalvus rutilus]|uniref:Thioredoxin domain-containing protein n=1 Tax=Natronosalvus rutilus TaxID=2953753 RepID=A0A9E7SVD6_9EURY|nr:thioredoxin domain-containing protein [Natronosalvus rutilus]UTF52901.1 thioredoxin domain-containing protein [Natronosalvus rutilus]